ncbi:MAG: hypothetical protein JXB47_15490 [Anaerolineae bacterium]|nr:hypothetical protein [Anaerolineae bacterium]
MKVTKRRFEQGQGTLIFAIGIIAIMWVVIGLADDLGRLALAEIRALDAVELSAQDAANLVDPFVFDGTQRVRIGGAANAFALYRADMLTGGRVTIEGVAVSEGRIRAAGSVDVPMKWMWRLGVPVGRRAFAVDAMSSYGLQVENE